MDKQIVITSQTTRNDLLMQLMKESKTVSQNIILVLESIPGFINTHVSLAVFNAMLKGYPKPIYWYSRHPAVINFLRLSNILRIWKPPINEDKNPGANPLFKIIPSSFKSSSQQTAPSSPSISPAQNSPKTTAKPIPAQSTTIITPPTQAPRLTVPPVFQAGSSPAISKSPAGKNLPNLSPSEDPRLSSKSPTIKTLASSSQSGITAKPSLRPVDTSELPTQTASPKPSAASPFDRAAVAASMAKAPKQIMDKVRDKTTQARMSQIQKDLDKIQPPDFNNLDDLIYKIESTKQALEKKHNSLNKSVLDKEIDSDYGSFNWGLSVLILVGVTLIGFFIYMAIMR